MQRQKLLTSLCTTIFVQIECTVCWEQIILQLLIPFKRPRWHEISPWPGVQIPRRFYCIKSKNQLYQILPYHDHIYALSFYGSKIILDRPNYFGWLPIILDGSNSFWTGPNHFGQFQITKTSPEKSNWNLTKMIWTCPKQIGPDQNNLYITKMIWPVQNHFGPIEGQGIRPQEPFYPVNTLILWTFDSRNTLIPGTIWNGDIFTLETI